MRVTSMLPDMQYQIQQAQQQLNTALQQVSTGKRVNQLSDDPAASASMVRSLNDSSTIDRYTATGSTVLSTLQTADSALSAVVTSLTSAISLGTEGANGTLTSTDRAGIAAQVGNLLASIVSEANTSFQGSYVFAGTASTTPPFVQASSSYTSAATTLTPATPLTIGASTTFSDAGTGQSFTFKAAAGNTVATLTAAVAAAVTAGTLSAGTTAAVTPSGSLALSSAAGLVVTSTDPALGSLSATAGSAVAHAYAYVGNNDTNRVAIDDTLSVASNLSGSQVFTTGSNVLPALGQLITALQSGTDAQIGAATQAISTGLNRISQQRVPLGNDMSQVSAEASYLAQETVNLSTRQSSLVGINLAQAATNLSQAELTNSAVLEAAAKVAPETLLDYLK